MPSLKSTIQEDRLKASPPDATLPKNMYILGGPETTKVLELALLVMQPGFGDEELPIARSLASHVTETIMAGLDSHNFAAVVAQCQQRNENRKLVAATAAELQELRAFVGEESRERGTELAEEIRKLVEKIKNTDRTAEQDDEWLKCLEL